MSEDEKMARELGEAVDSLLGEGPDYEYQVMLKYTADRLRFEPGVPDGAEIEVLAVVPIMWSGWEGDSGACLYRLLPDGEPQLHVFDHVHVSRERLLEVLKERAAAYQQMAKRTREFIAHVKHARPEPSGMSDAEKIWLIKAVYAQKRGTPFKDTITTSDIADALGRDDEERAALAEAFRAADRDKDLWLECADIWIAHCKAWKREGGE